MSLTGSTNPESQPQSPSEWLAAVFKFCPHCGSPCFVRNDFKSLRCEDCGFVYYLNPSSATTTLIVNDSCQLLVIHRKEEPARGMLDLPGGFCDAGETMEEGAVREVREETGLAVSGLKFLFTFPNRYLYSGLTIPTLDGFFLCRVPDGVGVHASDDAADASWIDLAKVDASAFAFESTRRGVTKFLQNTTKYLKK